MSRPFIEKQIAVDNQILFALIEESSFRLFISKKIRNNREKFNNKLSNTWWFR